MIDHLNLKLQLFCRHTSCFRLSVLKVQDLGNFELSPMAIVNEIVRSKLNILNHHFYSPF